MRKGVERLFDLVIAGEHWFLGKERDGYVIGMLGTHTSCDLHGVFFH